MSIRARGLTIVEFVIVMAVLVIIVGSATFAWRIGSVHRDAATLASAITSIRWLAVTTGVPVAIVRRRDGALFRRVGHPLGCDEAAIDNVPIWIPNRSMTLTWPAAGLAFGAHGRPLRCDGSAVGNATITLTGRDGSSAAVIVASLGRVRWDRR